MAATLYKDFSTRLNIIYFAMIGSGLFFLIVSYFIKNQNGKFDVDDEFKRILQIGLLVIIITLPQVSNFIYKKQLERAVAEKDLPAKLNSYFVANLIKFALLEAPGLMSIAFYFITGDYLFLIGYILILVLFLINRPTDQKLIEHLQLTHQEKADLGI